MTQSAVPATPQPEIVSLPVAAGRGAPARLPTPLSSLIGRADEIANVAALLRDPTVRLVTLTGPGGVGKTRLALAAAAECGGDFQHGVAFIDLASIVDPNLVTPAIAQALNFRGQGNSPIGEQLSERLRTSHLLLVLDNFEQVVAAAPQITALLLACSRLTALVTSRTLLHVSGERPVPVQPLDEEAATHLFLERARASRIGAETASSDEEGAGAEVVAEICRRLDGLPLAIELAAARSAIFTPSMLLTRLERRLPLLTGGPQDIPARQQTLRGTIAWSYDLLTPEERRVFKCMATFSGGCTIDAAEAVCGPLDSDDREDIPRPDIIETVESLIRQSLLRLVNVPGGNPRLMLLETVREFAVERLDDEGGIRPRQRHAEYYLDLAMRAQQTFWGDAPGNWRALIEVDLGNLRAALSWATTHGETETALRLASALFDPLWLTGNDAQEQGQWLERALAMPGGSPDGRVTALLSAAWAAQEVCDFTRGRALNEAALALAREHGDARGVASAISAMGHTALHAGDVDEARRLLLDALSRFRALGASGHIAWTLCHLAALDSRDAIDEGGDPAALARAEAAYEEALILFRAIGQERGITRALHGVAYLAYKRRDLPRALVRIREALALDWAEQWPIDHYLEDIADIAGRTGRGEIAARLYGAATAMRERAGRPIEPLYRAEYDRDVAVARRAIGEEAFAAAFTEGAALSPKQAVDVALDPALEVAAAEAMATPRPQPAADLTRRETDVLRLLILGQTDAEIAATLFISVRTVEYHVGNILGKLGVRTRTAAANAAISLGLAQPGPSSTP